MWMYIGKSFILGIPARNLTDEEVRKIGISRVRNCGLYKHVKTAEPQTADKGAKKWQVSKHYEKSS